MGRETLVLGMPSTERLRSVLIGGKEEWSVFAGGSTAGFADGIGEAARFHRPDSMILDESGDGFYVSDTFNHRIRYCDLKTRSVTTVAGNGQPDSKHKFSGSAPSVCVWLSASTHQIPERGTRVLCDGCIISGACVLPTPHERSYE